MLEIVYLDIDRAHPDDFVYKLEGHFWWLLVHTKTQSIFHLADKDIIVPADSAVLYSPHQLAHYGAFEGEYVNSYIRFFTDDPIITQSHIPLGMPFPLKDPEGVKEIFSIMSRELYYDYKSSQRTVKMLMNILMAKLEDSFEQDVECDYARLLYSLRYEMRMNPAYPWTVKEMADRVHVSQGYLQLLYKKQFGVSCMQDVVNARIALAKEYLNNTEASSAKIAQLCGYQNVEHFCRQFRNETGMSPMKYHRLIQEEKNSDK